MTPNGGTLFSPCGRRGWGRGGQAGTLSPRERIKGSGGQPLQLADKPDGLLAMGAAHVRHGAKAAAHRRALRLAEDLAPQVRIELHTGHTGGLAVRHAGNGTADAGGDAAGTTSLTTFHVIFPLWGTAV